MSLVITPQLVWFMGAAIVVLLGLLMLALCACARAQAKVAVLEDCNGLLRETLNHAVQKLRAAGKEVQP
jgi:hypothetical protein